MGLIRGLTARLVAVAIACVALAAVWTVAETALAIREETGRSADRVAERLAAGGGEQAEPGAPGADADALAAAVGPGTCVAFDTRAGEARRLCAAPGFGAPAPGWFGAAAVRVLPLDTVATTPVAGDAAGRTVTATVDRAAVTALVWREMRLLLGLAAAMAGAMSVVLVLVIGHALAPVRGITRGLRLVAEGRFGARLPSYRVAEFDRIASAFNDMARRVEETAAERVTLTRRLIEVQEAERQGLARDLHDEFGQCLTAAGALAASIEGTVSSERPDVADDARAIAAVVRRMMGTLRSALARLRPPDLEAFGLEGSLHALVSAWNARLGGGAAVSLTVDGPLEDLPAETAVNLYRIAQEAVTNAVRHGRPSRIDLAVRRPGGGEVILTVADDGGGDPAIAASRPGFGLVGIRERLQLIGGRLTIGRSDGGLALSAAVPLAGAGR